MTGKLAIYGTGGFGRELVGAARRRASDAGLELVFADDNDDRATIFDIPVLRLDALDPATDQAIIAVGDADTRKRMAQKLDDREVRAFDLIAPSAIIGPDVTFGDGLVLCDQTLITASVKIGLQFQCNIYSYVAHDCVIGDYVTFAPKVCCNGNVHVHDGAYIGTGAVIRQGVPGAPLIIGAGSIVGMGAVVTKDVPAGAVVLGNPARQKS